jgi:transferase CAF17, mitochondrial
MSKAAAAASGSFGRLWGRAHEVLGPEMRRVLRVSGPGATTYLQGLVTCDLTQPPTPPRTEQAVDAQSTGSSSLPTSYGIEGEAGQESLLPEQSVVFDEELRAACFLDNKGRIVTDALLWRVSDHDYYVDLPASVGDSLLAHLKQFLLRRSKVKVQDVTNTVASHVVFGSLNAKAPPPGYLARMDPRHPSLGMRILRLPEDNAAATSSDATDNPDYIQDRQSHFSNLVSKVFPRAPGNYDLIRRLVGVAEGSELTGRVALEANQEFLNAVSFHKGCYLGQELTARVQHTGVLRKRIMPLFILPTTSALPPAWSLASSLQEMRAQRRLTRDELMRLPPRLPRLGVLTAGNLVSIMSGAIEPPKDAIDEEARKEWEEHQMKTTKWLQDMQGSFVAGAKLVDHKDGQTVGQVVSPPVPGTNVVLALMKLDRVGLHLGNAWSRTNKIQIQGQTDNKAEWRYLPYLPLWWPELDVRSGKGRSEDDDGIYEEETRDPNAPAADGDGTVKVVVEEVPLNETEKPQ